MLKVSFGLGKSSNMRQTSLDDGKHTTQIVKYELHPKL